MKFNTMFYTAFDLNGMLEVGIFFPNTIQKGLECNFAIEYYSFSTGEPND